MIIQGALQLWTRTCTPDGRCGLPEAVGAAHAVDGTVAAPDAPGHLNEFTMTIREKDLVATLQVFWVAPPDGSPSYLVAQTTIPGVAECTQYASVPEAVYAPVGACAGYRAGNQYGVSFSK